MKKPLKVTLLLGFFAASVVLLWLLPERGEEMPAVVVNEAEAGAVEPLEVPEPPVAAAEPRDGVKVLCGILGDGSATTRLDAAHALPADLNAEEYELILEHILRAARPEGMYYRAWHAVFNDTLNALVRAQAAPIQALPVDLRRIIQDAKRHVVIRDYALQHLLAYAEFRMVPAERLPLLHALWPEVRAGGHTLPGTYLLALLHTPDRHGWPPRAETAKRAWALLQDEQTHILSRITALQTCGQLGYLDALPLALRIASDPQAHMTLRTAAIATIGDLGSAAEANYLNELNRQVPPRLQIAVTAALSRLEKQEESI